MNDPRPLLAEELRAAAAPCVTSSFQAECVVLVHMLRSARPDIPVLFLDTVHHFAETYAYRDALAERWGLNLITLRAEKNFDGPVAAKHGGVLRRHKVGRSSERWRGMTRGSPVCGANSPEPRDARRGGTLYAANGKPCCKGQPARDVDDARRLGVREGARDSTAAAVRTRLHQHRV